MTRDVDHVPEPPERVRSVLSQPDTWADPPPDLQATILNTLRRERTEMPPAIPIASRSEPKRRRRRLLVSIAAAVVALAAAGITATVLRTPAPDAEARLSGTALAVGATGQVDIRKTPSGFRIDLDARGLPPAAPGTYYQAWLKNTAGQLVTIGTFHARNGSDDVILWSGVDPRDYPTMTVTVQQEGAGPQSSGKVVLVGPIRQ